MKFKDVVISEASTEAKVAALALLLDKELIKLADTVLNVKKLQGPKGEQGIQGPKGEQGDRGFDGTNGKDGIDGKDGKDGEDGKQGVGVADAKIDFDGSLVITLTDGTEINAGDVVPLDTAEKIRVIGNGGGTSQSVLDAIAAIQATIATYGTMALQNANNVAITGGAIDGTTIGGTTPAAGTFTTLTATTGVYAGGASSNIDLNVNSKGTGSIFLNTGNGPAFKVVDVGVATSTYWGAMGSSATPYLTSYSGSSDGFIQTNGAANVRFRTNYGSAAVEQFRIAHTASAVNYVQVTGAATTKATVVSSQGSDSNISSVFQSKGTGAIDLAAGSSGVNISNGGTVTAITRTNSGTNYTSAPTVVISAPTTAGGVQATATVPLSYTSVTIVSGGTGYTVGDVLTVSGGTYTIQAQFVVATVSGGVITGLTLGTLSYGNYTVAPTNPVSVTGGTGTGATFNMVWGIWPGFTITNAGSGYVEQPTVSFSGGGGSGAAAYATVGSGTIVRSLGTNLDFYTPNGVAFRVSDFGGGTTTGFWRANGYAGNPGLSADGSGSNIGGSFSSKGTGTLNFFTNNFSQTQLVVAHTASAVNYVQVTGAATGGRPTISSQGSDANIDLALTPKGTGLVRFGTYTAGAPAATGYISIKAADGTTYKVLVGT